MRDARLSMLGLAGALASSCAVGCAAGSSAERDIGAALDAWHLAAARGDGDAYFGGMTPDAVFIGTDAGERWEREAFESYADPYFNRPPEPGEPGPFRPAWVYTPGARHVVLDRSGRVAWFDELLDSRSYGTARGTGVVVRGADARWRVAHYALTFPIPNELAREFTDRIKAFEASRRD